MEFRGSLVAIVTPFNARGQIDVRALERLVEWQIGEGTDGIICSGATGESTSLSLRERQKILEICLRVSGGKIPIIAGTGTPNTNETVLFTERALRGGASGCLVITPFYNKPTQRGCVLHYREVAKVGLPVIAYHNPGRTTVRLTVETLAEIGTITGVVGVKEASGDLEFIRAVKKVSSLPILAGEDWLTFETIKAGGVGAISTVGNIIPKAWREMIHFCLDGKWEEGKGISDRFEPLYRTIFSETNPQCVKYVLSLMGKCKPSLRLPLVEPLDETQTELKRTLKSLQLET